MPWRPIPTAWATGSWPPTAATTPAAATVWALGWFPAIGYVGFTDDPLEWLRHMMLPGLSLGLASAAVIGQDDGSIAEHEQYLVGLSADGHIAGYRTRVRWT